MTRLISSLLLAATLVASGCSSRPLLAMGQLAGAMGAKSAVSRPTLEEAYPAALAAARERAGAQTTIALIMGGNIGRDGRARDDDSNWHFMFRQGSGEGMLTVDVSASGALDLAVMNDVPMLAGWTYQPGVSATASRAIENALASGLAGERFQVELAPADGLFFGGLPSYLGPPTYLVCRKLGEADYRLVTGRSGKVLAEPTATEMEQCRRLLVPLVKRWHLELTGGEDRPVVAADLLRAGAVQQGADLFIRFNDTDGDRKVTLTELIGHYSTPMWQKGWREAVIKPEFWRADADRDEHLTFAEAAKLRFAAMSFDGATRYWPLPVTQTQLIAADKNGDGSLDLDEYMPLGMERTLYLVEHDPRAAAVMFFGTEAKPWSH
jgi:hypothetical protein